MNMKNKEDDRKKQRLANAQNILSNNVNTNYSAPPANVGLSSKGFQVGSKQNIAQSGVMNPRRSDGLEDVQLNDFNLNQFQQKDDDLSELSQKSNVLLPFDDPNLPQTQFNLNSQTQIVGQSNNPTQNSIKKTNNLVAPISSERGQVSSSHNFEMNELNTQTKTGTTKPVQNQSLVNISSQNKKATPFQKKQQRGQRQANPSMLNQTKVPTSNNNTMNANNHDVKTDNLTSQHLLYNNSKEMAIYDTIENNSGFDSKEKNIHILDEEDPSNHKRMSSYQARLSLSKKRESIFDKDKKLKLQHSKSSIELIGILCQAQAKFCVLFCQAIRKITQKFENCVTKIFRSKIGSEVFWLFGAVILCWFAYLGMTVESEEMTKSNQFDELKQYIAKNLIAASFVFMAYGVIFLSLRNWTVYLILFFVQAVPCLIAFMYYVYDTLKKKNREHIPSPDYIQCAFVFGLYFFWMATYFVVKDLKENFNKTARNIFMLFWCIISAAIVIGYTVYTVSTTWELNFHWGENYIKVLAGPYILILALCWVYMHFKFFDPLLQKVPARQMAADELQLEKIEKEKALQKKREAAKVVIPDQGDEQHVSFIQKTPIKSQPNEEENEGEFLEEADDIEGGAFGFTVEANTAQKDDIANMDEKAADQPVDEISEEEKERLEQERLQQEEEERLRKEEEERDQELREIEQRRLLLKIELRRDKPDPRMKVIMQNYSVIFCSSVFGGSLIVLTVISLLNMSHDLQLGKAKEIRDIDIFQNIRGFYMSVFYVFIVPIICLLGTALIFSQASDRIKLIIFPVVGGLVPVLFFMPFSLVTDLFYHLRPLRLFFGIGPCILGLYWVTLIFIKIKSIHFSMLLNGYICIFFIVPLLYILPQRGADYYSHYDDIAYNFQLALIIIGIILLLTLVFVDIFLEIRKRFRRRALKKRLIKEGRRLEIEELEKEEFEEGQKFEISNIFKYDLYDFGLWGNAFGYIFTLTILAFMYFNQPEWISLQQSGAIIGMQPVIFFLFLVSLIVLLLKIIPEKQKTAVSFSEQITQLVENKGERQITLDNQHKARRSILAFSFFYAPVILGIVLAVKFDDEEIRLNVITMMIGFPIIAILFLLFYKLKQNFEGLSRTAVPALVVFCWIFLYLPLAGILPSSVLYLSDDSEANVNYERLLLGFLIILLFLGICLFAIFIHLYFKRRDFEKKFLFIASKVIKKLAKSHVKSDYHVINLMYQGYISKGAEGIKESLINLQKPVYYAEVSDKDPDPRYSKVIIDAYAYEKLNDKSKRRTFNCWDKLLSYFMYIFCCCYKDYYARMMAQIAAEKNKKGLGGDGDGNGDGKNGLSNIMDEALKKQQEQEEEEEIIIEEDPWLKKYIIQKQFRPIHPKIIEPLRRYDLGQQLEISKPWTDTFIKNIFYVFAQGSESKFEGIKWKDYVMFKELLVKGGVIPCDEILDHEIDLIFNKFTSVDHKPNKKPITYYEFPKILKEVAKRKFPFELDADEALGKLCKLWLYPYLLWNLPPIRGLYRHEWDYVLFLLKLYGLDDLYKELIEEDEGFYYRLKKELGLMPKDDLDDDIVLPDIDGRLKGRKSKCQRCMERFQKYLKSMLQNSIYFCKSLCMLDKEIKTNGKDEIDLEVNMVNNNLLAPQPYGAKKKKDGTGYLHEESPEWPEIVDIMIEEIQHQEKEFSRLKDKEIGFIELRPNLTNYFVMFFKVLEYMAIGFLAFRPAVVEWEFPLIVYQVLNFIDTETPEANFSYKLGLGVILAGLFFIILYQSVQRIRTLKYGFCEQKDKKQRCNPDFFQIQFTHMVGYAFIFWIYKICLDACSCDYAVIPKYLYQDPVFVCLEERHFALMGLGIFGILLFYPMASFLWPNVQYQNRSLDLRYDPTYLVLAGQVKFLLAGGTAFLAHPDVQAYYFGFSSFLLLFFAFLTNKMKPCVFKKVNPLDMGGYFLCGWLHLSALIVKVTESTMIAWVVLGIGSFLIVLLSLFNWKIIHDRHSAEKQKKLDEKKAKDALDAANKPEEEIPIEEQEPEPVMDVDRILYEEWDQQLKTYDPELLKITKELQASKKKRLEDRNKKLKELERRQKILAQLDKEDEEDGIKPKEEELEEVSETQKKNAGGLQRQGTQGLQKKPTIQI